MARRPWERGTDLQRLERGLAGARTFWEISSNDRVVEERWGDVGGKARKRSSTFPSADAAEAEITRLVAARRAEGFAPRAALPAPKPITATKRLVDAELERMLAETPTDVAAWKTYADWLLEHGEHWGEVIAHATSGLSTQLHRAATEKQWLAGISGCDLDWRKLGVVVSAELRPKRIKKVSIADLLARMFAHPAGRLVRFLTIELPPDDPGGTFQPIVDAIAAGGPLPLLELLVLRRRGHAATQSQPIADLSALWAAAPRLDRLDLDWNADHPGGTPCSLGAIAEARLLQSLSLDACGLPASVAIDVGAARLRRLRYLKLGVGPRTHGATVALSSLVGILGGEGVPNLETLVLDALDWDAGLVEALAASPLVARLKSLWLTDGVLGTAASAAFVAHAARFQHLEELFLDNNVLSEAEVAAIRAGIPRTTSYHQRPPGSPAVEHSFDPAHDAPEDEDDDDDDDD